MADTTFNIYQINFMSDSDVARSLRFGPKSQVEANQLIGRAAIAGEMSKVAKITAGTLDQVFEIGNMGPENRIERLGRMTSVSVGNVVEDPETGNAWMCGQFGWVDISNYTLRLLKERAI